jgi:hypothetical protein
VFVYALVANEVHRPNGIVIFSLFIATMISTSLLSEKFREYVVGKPPRTHLPEGRERKEEYRQPDRALIPCNKSTFIIWSQVLSSHYEPRVTDK